MCRVGSNLFSSVGKVVVVVSLLLLFPAVSFSAEDLLEFYAHALRNDPNFSGAQFTHDASLERVKIARAGLLPKISAEGTYTQTQQNIISSDNKVYGSGTSNFPTTAQTLSLTQPLINIASLANVNRAKADAKGAGLQLEAAKQGLAIRVAKAYLGVLASRDNVAFLETEEAAVGMYHELIKSKFASGLAPKTDYLDARARISEVRANKIAAENNLDDAIQSLKEIAGQATAGIAGLREEIPLVSPDPNDIDAWKDAAIKHNPALGYQRQIVEAAHQEVRRQAAGHYPYLNLEATYNRSKTEGTLFGGGSDVTTTNALVRLNIPLFEGGVVNARTREALNLHKAAVQEEERQRRALVKEARAAYQGVGSAVDRVKALREAVESQKLAAEAKREGYKSGLFAFRAVLDAERDLYRAKRDYAIARYDYVMNCLRLKKAAGTLDLSDITAVNDWLESSSAGSASVGPAASLPQETVKVMAKEASAAPQASAVVNQAVSPASTGKEAEGEVLVTKSAVPAIDQKVLTPVIASDPREEVLVFIDKWKDAWMNKDFDGFIKMYDPVYRDAKGDYRNFVQSKKKFFNNYNTINVNIEQIDIKKQNDVWVVKFLQSFQGDKYSDKTWKSLIISSNEERGLRITGEI